MYETFHRDVDGEAALIRRALQRLNEFEADGLVSYNGQDFDLDFLYKRSQILEEPVGSVDLHVQGRHVDIFADRKVEAGKRGQEWPGLEECLDSYDIDPAKTIWGGREVDNTRFGEELGPSFLDAVRTGDDGRVASLREVIDHYLITDLEANIALYYADISEEFKPFHLGSEKVF